MKVALSWLQRYLDLSGTRTELADLLTFAGIEVEGISQMPALGPSVVAARVVSAERVPKTDHLQLCKVDIGTIDYAEKDEEGLIQVICGAPNCEAGMMAVLALPGTELKEFQIKKAKIRGIESHGMLCSERELGISDNHGGIVSLPETTQIGTLADTLFELPDTVYDLEITPNRSDLLGYVGISRDLSAKLSRRMIKRVTPQLEVAGADLKLGLYNEAKELCPRYTARVIKSVKIGPSPLWLKLSLIKSGIRPINNVVDITNYVMMETGHPLHAFDYDKLSAKDEAQGYPDIVVRRAQENEEFIALDGKKYILDGDELVIADGKKVSALAGVMGSEYSGISDDTVNIVLESAAFHAGSIRRCSYKHKLSTDSSYRFERDLAANYADLISDRAAEMIVRLAGGSICGELYDSYPKKHQNYILGVRPKRFEHLIGYTLPGDKIREILENLGFTFLQYGDFMPGMISDLDKIQCHHAEEMKRGVTEFSEIDFCQHTHYYEVPAFRKDISREVDIIEELARLSGYDMVPRKAQKQQIMDRHAYRIENHAADWLINWGAFETLNYSFCDPTQMQDLGFDLEKLDFVRLINPQSSNQSVMRISLIPQLLTNLAYNLNHSERNVKLFELAKVYLPENGAHQEKKRLSAIFTGNTHQESWQEKGRAIDYFWVKGCFTGLLRNLDLDCVPQACDLPYLVPSESSSYSCATKVVGSFGRIKPGVLEAWGIDSLNLKQDVWILDLDLDALVAPCRSRSVCYQEIPRFPAVSRDLSFLLADRFSYADLRASVMSLDNKLIREVEVFDEYRSTQIPEGFRSLSLHISLQDQEKTLTDERVDQLMASVLKTLEKKYEISMR